MELMLGSKTLWTFEFKSTKDWKFISSLNLLEVPVISAKWSFEENFLPNVDNQILTSILHSKKKATSDNWGKHLKFCRVKQFYLLKIFMYSVD